jgi:hypothetical protein
VKNFLSGVFRHAAQQGYFDGANPVKLAEIPAFATNATEPVRVIPQLAQRLSAHRLKCGRPISGPIFANSSGRPLDLEGCHRREMKDVIKKDVIKKDVIKKDVIKKDVIKKAGVGWHGFRRGLASNLKRLGVDDSVIQGILRQHRGNNAESLHQYRIPRCDPSNEAVLCLTVLHLCSRSGQQERAGSPVSVAKCFYCNRLMAEGEGFEPPVPFQVQRFSRPPVSTTHTSLRAR